MCDTYPTRVAAEEIVSHQRAGGELLAGSDAILADSVNSPMPARGALAASPDDVRDWLALDGAVVLLNHPARVVAALLLPHTGQRVSSPTTSSAML